MLQGSAFTQNDTANMGVTPNNGGTIPRYILKTYKLDRPDIFFCIPDRPSETISGKCLLYYVYSTLVSAWGSCL